MAKEPLLWDILKLLGPPSPLENVKDIICDFTKFNKTDVFFKKVKIIINLYEVFLVAVYGNYKKWPLW